MHISSLPSPYGVGTMGKDAREFVDFLVRSGQSYWQILPVCPTSYGDSPYQSYSTFAGNPYFIDLDKLEQEGLLEACEFKDIDWGGTSEKVDYGELYNKRYSVLKLAPPILFSDDGSSYKYNIILANVVLPLPAAPFRYK